jgi:hypothetical protein
MLLGVRVGVELQDNDKIKNLFFEPSLISITSSESRRDALIEKLYTNQLS